MQCSRLEHPSEKQESVLNPLALESAGVLAVPVNQTQRYSITLKYCLNRLTSFTHASLAPDGVCRGMCLDWVRRIHHGKRRPDGAVFTYNSSKDPLGYEKKRLSKIGKIHSLFDEKLNAIPPSSGETLLVRHVRKTHPQIPLEHGTIEEIKGLKNPDDRQTVIREFKKLVTDVDLRGMYLAWDVPGKNAYAFSELKSDWKKQTQRKSDFGSLQLVADTIYLAPQSIDGALLWKDYVRECLSSMTAGGSAMLLAGCRAGDSAGHAVAFNVDPTKKRIYYMDPNEGEFRFESADVLTEDSKLEDFFVKHWDALYRYDFDWACWLAFS